MEAKKKRREIHAITQSKTKIKKKKQMISQVISVWMESCSENDILTFFHASGK